MFVAIIQQGMVLDQKVTGVGDDHATLLAEAQAAAQLISDQQTGEAEGYSAVVLPCPPSSNPHHKN